MRICDVTQFYSPRSGGVKRYLHEKIAYVQAHRPGDEHLLIVPGPRSEMHVDRRSTIATIASPLVSRTTQYRALLNLRAVEEIIETQRPNVIESADPYQLGWAAARIAHRHRIPVVAYYHSDFAEAYLRRPAERLGRRITARVMSAARRYTVALYRRFAITFVPSAALADKLRSWGIPRVEVLPLGVNTNVFCPHPDDRAGPREALGVPERTRLLLYVGRLAGEKNTRVLMDAFAILSQRRPGAFHLLVIGDGQDRQQVLDLAEKTRAVTLLPPSDGGAELAQFYRAADLFVHPGTQETFGLVALEGQACGTPIVGIRGSALDSIIEHPQESWAAENSAAALAEAIERTCEFDLRGMGATAAMAIAARYGWSRVFDRLFCFYRDVCKDYHRNHAG